MRPSILPILCVLVLVPACRPDPVVEIVEPLEASYQCLVVEGAPVWSFALALSGPADEAGSQVLVFSEKVPNDFGYSMDFEGADGTDRADFSLTLGGTDPGDDPFPGDVPFACEDDPQVVFCGLDALSRVETCWACEGAGGDLPSGADSWMACG